MTALAELVDRAKLGDENALAELFNRYKKQLRAMIAFRMDRHLKARVAPSDILQETYLDLAEKLPEFEKKNVSFLVWLRLVAKERLLNVHRHHVDAQKRDPRREQNRAKKETFDATSILLVENLLGRYTSVCGKAIKAEQRLKLNSVLEEMDETDREVIALRIFEGLTNGEVAEVLGITKQATSKRFFRAIDRLEGILEGVPGFG